MEVTGKYQLKYNGSIIQTGTLAIGSKLGVLTMAIETGPGAGTTLPGYYTEQKGRDVTHFLFSVGKDAQDIPTGWDAPWIKGGVAGKVWVWILTETTA